MKKTITMIFLLLSYNITSAEVRMNPSTKLMEADACVRLATSENPRVMWSFIQFQPIGSLCEFKLQNGVVVRGHVLPQTSEQQIRLKEFKLKLESQGETNVK